jgi:fatty-acyl-CoA synthase
MLSINYTSGTTGKPKGVMYHHRGAYLQALAMAAHMRLDCASTYLWTLPMFHCNGWCFTWGVTAAGATHLCLRKLDPALVWRHLRESGVTHFCAAPTVLIMIAWADAAKHGKLPRTVHAATGGAPPTPAILTRMAELDIEVTHLYGLTETFGPAVVCEWRAEWSQLPITEQGQLKARQGVGNVIAQNLRIVDVDGRDVPADAQTIGEIALRGNNVMLGYYRDDEATRRAAPDGWFRTGDLGVMHADRYVEIKDRSKDIILSGGENIPSVEVERALSAHAAVMEAAVVAGPDPKWGEVPVAYVTLKPGATASEAELIAHARSLLAHFKAPKKIVFGELPKNATGKIQKFVLRERAKNLANGVA